MVGPVTRMMLVTAAWVSVWLTTAAAIMATSQISLLICIRQLFGFLLIFLSACILPFDGVEQQHLDAPSFDLFPPPKLVHLAKN